jgi:conjugal transfer pilin signal peptidase TrbI
MQPADRLIRSASARRLVLWGGLGAGALALSSLAAFAQGHALMINVSPSLPYWALWVTRGRLCTAGISSSSIRLPRPCW